MLNPLVFSRPELLAFSDHELFVLQYELQLAVTSLFFAILVVFFLVLFLRWLLPRYWYKFYSGGQK